MTADSQLENKMRWLGTICFSFAVGIALLSLAVWLSGEGSVAVLGGDAVVMAPSAAVAIGMLAGASLLRWHRPCARSTRWMAGALAVCAVMVSVLAIARCVCDIDLTIKHLLVRADMAGRNSSPVTGVLLVLSGVVLLFMLRPGNHRTLRQASAVMAVLVLGYVLWTPLHYGSAVIPMAWLSAVALALTSVGLLLMAGGDIWPLDLFFSDPMAEDSVLARRSERGFFTLFLVLASAIVGAGMFYVQGQRNDIRLSAQQGLDAIADLKVRQIVTWHDERIAQAHVIANDRLAMDSIRRVLASPPDVRAQADLAEWMDVLRITCRFKSVLVLDASGIRLAMPANKAPCPANIDAYLSAALQSNTVFMSDLCRDASVGSICVSVWIPVGVKAEPDKPADGVVCLQIDPNMFLYPLIQSWPTPSDSGETLLVRRDGDDVLFLNELRHRTNTALVLRLPLSLSNQLPAAQAVLGRTGIAEGRDYRNVDVIAAIRPVPGTSWFLVAKMDRSEMFTALYASIMRIGGVLGVLVLAAGLGICLFAHMRNVQWLRRQYVTERERKVLAERIAFLVSHANDIMLLADGDWRLIDANDRATEAYGYSIAELCRLTMQDLLARQSNAQVDALARSTGDIDNTVHETVHRRKDGTTFPVEASTRTVVVEGAIYHQSVIRDITERRRKDQRLLDQLDELCRWQTVMTGYYRPETRSERPAR